MRKLALVILAATAAPALAANWVTVGSEANGTVWAVETETAIRLPGEVRVWVRLDHSADRREGARMSRGMLIIWCQSRRFHWESLAAYGADGHEMPTRWPRVTAFDNIAPDSAVESVMQWGCPSPAAASSAH